MVPRKKRDKFKNWLTNFFPSKDTSREGSGAFFENAESAVVKDSIMTSIQGDQHNNTVQNTVINIQVDHTTARQIMSLLSQHIIQGAAHDSSARTPPPRCHPETRIKLIARITNWFEGQGLPELLLWITGPAGVGKSAIVQTFAEYLAKSKALGASVFISRPNRRNNPDGIFITIAYQLATRIEAYRHYVNERISLDPELLRGDMETQFTTFIVEPFVEKKIGAGGKRWGILLDGLDELRGEDAQCNIIHLVSTFAREHQDVPLLWIIASRPESHISDKFEDEEVHRSCWTEYVPIDSTEACEDVERFFRSSFKAVQKKFRHSVQSDWPSNTDFLTLTAAASGLFAYAEVVMRFIRDPDHGDPTSRFEILIAIINRSSAVPTNENPFVHLDALYHEILSAIPSTFWPAAKLLLGFTIYEQDFCEHFPSDPLVLGTLRGMSILFSLRRNTVYVSLIKCRSVLKIPDWKVAHKEKLMFHHASFADHLRDSRRSANFHVGNIGDIEEIAALNLVKFWKECSGDDVAPALVKATWLQECSSFDGERPSFAVAKFHGQLFRDIINSVVGFPRQILLSQNPALYEAPLLEVHMAKLCYCLLPEDLSRFVQHLRNTPSNQNSNLSRGAQLQTLKFEHLDWKVMSPTKVYQGRMGKVFNKRWRLSRPDSRSELIAFISQLEDVQRCFPRLRAVVFGGLPSGRVVAFGYEEGNETSINYVIPYPE